MMFKKFLLLSFLLIPIANAEFVSWEEITANAKKENINTKMISHAQCFFEKHENSSFDRKFEDHQIPLQCRSNKYVTLENKRVIALIDYTKDSNEERMYLVDRKTGKISHMAVAHGRYNAGFLNLKLSHNKNSIKRARYFSNEPGSNAPSSGYFIAGREYNGKFGRSLTLHGIEEGINDNACARAVVIHKHRMMTDRNAYVLSSGCPMVSGNMIDHVIDLLVTNSNEYGSLVFIYGKREAAWEAGSCEGNFRF